MTQKGLKRRWQLSNVPDHLNHYHCSVRWSLWKFLEWWVYVNNSQQLMAFDQVMPICIHLKCLKMCLSPSKYISRCVVKARRKNHTQAWNYTCAHWLQSQLRCHFSTSLTIKPARYNKTYWISPHPLGSRIVLTQYEPGRPQWRHIRVQCEQAFQFYLASLNVLIFKWYDTQCHSSWDLGSNVLCVKV